MKAEYFNIIIENSKIPNFWVYPYSKWIFRFSKLFDGIFFFLIKSSYNKEKKKNREETWFES